VDNKYPKEPFLQIFVTENNDHKIRKKYLKGFVRGLGKAVNFNCFSDEIHGIPTIKKFIIC
jgi:transposase-like protein